MKTREEKALLDKIIAGQRWGKMMFERGRLPPKQEKCTEGQKEQSAKDADCLGTTGCYTLRLACFGGTLLKGSLLTQLRLIHD